MSSINKDNLKIVFFGTPDFAVESLRVLVEGGYNIVGVVTMPDKPAGRGHRLFQSPVKQYAQALGLKILQPVSLKDPQFVSELKSLGGELFIVIAFRMLPEIVWQMPRLGTFNLHASLLPRYRGAAPINWAIINGDTQTGVTTFFLKHEIDTGDIIAREAIDITPEDNVGTIHDRLMILGAKLTIDTVDSIIAGTLTTTPQELLAKGETPTPAPKIFRETCHIDWHQSSTQVHNLVRGLSPYPAAWCTMVAEGYEPTDIKVFVTRIANDISAQVGDVVIDGDKLFVGCNNGAVELLEVQPTGKRRMPVADFLRGARLTTAKMI